MTRAPDIRERSVVRLSVIPSTKYSCSLSPPILAKGSTTIDSRGDAGDGCITMQQLFDPAFPAGRQNYWKSGLANTLADDLIEATTEYARKMPSPHTAFLFAEMHGAYSRVAKTATAYFHRDLQYDAIILSGWT